LFFSGLKLSNFLHYESICHATNYLTKLYSWPCSNLEARYDGPVLKQVWIAHSAPYEQYAMHTLPNLFHTGPVMPYYLSKSYMHRCLSIYQYGEQKQRMKNIISAACHTQRVCHIEATAYIFKSFIYA
jgi:hypothetical protein